jgi:hypothetical protein
MTSRGLLILRSLVKEAQLLLGVFSDVVNKCSLFLFTAFCCNSLQLFYRVSGVEAEWIPSRNVLLGHPVTANVVSVKMENT